MTAWWQADWRLWREVDWRSIPDGERPAQRWVLCVTGLVVVMGVALAVAWPLWAKLQSVLMAREHLARQTQLQQVNLLTARELAQQRERIQKHLALLGQRIPTATDAATDGNLAKAELAAMARRQGIQLKAIRLQAEPSPGPLAVQALELEGVAGYPNWGRWLESLSLGPRLMGVRSVQARGVGEGGEVSMTMTVVAWTRPSSRSLE